MSMSLADLPPALRKQAIEIINREDAERKRRNLEAESEESEAKEKKSKYHAKKIAVDMPDGTQHTFDSLKEYGRYQELLLMEQAGEITDLAIQKPYVLIPKQRDSKGKAVRETSYVADFVYVNADGETIVEDVKGYRGGQAYAVFTIKKKLMLHLYGIDIREV